ncbi:hypothetical protein NDU88_005955 [Pleurodeles waltl]|uniref:Uncharacterized protein n=1 Tax=Pleurodeles waltl TaxID=8319 RepID=A0AAV7VNE1_PLEWA|nr:hypothetical protein NDU88_005955 [Pleurodeles waltl]
MCGGLRGENEVVGLRWTGAPLSPMARDGVSPRSDARTETERDRSGPVPVRPGRSADPGDLDHGIPWTVLEASPLRDRGVSGGWAACAAAPLCPGGACKRAQPNLHRHRGVAICCLEDSGRAPSLISVLLDAVLWARRLEAGPNHVVRGEAKPRWSACRSAEDI